MTEGSSPTDTAEIFSGGFTLPNGSCAPPTPEQLAQTPPEYIDIEALMRRRLLLRIPVWIFSVCLIYVAIMLIMNAVRRGQGGAEDRNVIVLKYGLLFASCFTAINLTYNGVFIFGEVNGISDCNAAYKVENAMYWINISVIYTVLWLRQRVVYGQRCLREAVSKVTTFFSYAVVVLVIVLPVANPIIFASVLDFCFDIHARLCRVTSAVERYAPLIVAFELVAPMILPVTLLGLFAWPLIRYNQTSRKMAKRRRSVVGILRRVSLATAICLSTDIATMICNDKCDAFVAPTVRHVSLFCNLVCLLVTFAEWRQILFPMLPEKDITKSTRSASSRTPDSASA